MHAIKGGWLGQTFALSKCNESQGRIEAKKYRIRRSKEERKAMVETFIKKYQESSNGDFPSLNQTHKEVGGSFYTVREIVRDIIQENRVLGPAKFMVEEQTTDLSLEHHSLLSIATDLQDPLIMDSKQIEQQSDSLQDISEDLSNLQIENIQGISEGQSHLQTDNLQDTSEDQNNMETAYLKGIDEEMITVSNGQFSTSGHLKADIGPAVNGSHVNLTKEECIEPRSAELQVNPSIPEAKHVEKEMELKAKLTPLTADVIVETFPLRPVATLTDNMVKDQAEGRDLNNFSHEKLKKVFVEEGNGNISLEQDKCMKRSDFVDGRAMNESSSLLSGENSVSRDKEVIENAHPFFEGQKQSEEHIAHEFKGYEHLECKAAIDITTIHNQSEALSGTEAMPSQMSVAAKNLNETSTGVAKAGDKIANKTAEVSPDHVSLRKTNPTLDRINLESWDGKTKRPVKTGSNPLLTVFKAFVDAFLRFWSE